MENQLQNQPLTQEQMLTEILENSRKTKNYMKWQLIITVAFVVIPLIAALAIIPFAMSSLSSIYSLSSGTGSPQDVTELLNNDSVQSIINQYLPQQ